MKLWLGKKTQKDNFFRLNMLEGSKNFFNKKKSGVGLTKNFPEYDCGFKCYIISVLCQFSIIGQHCGTNY